MRLWISMETGWDPGNPDLKKRIFKSGQSLQALSEVKLQVQSLKRSTSPFFCAFTMRSPCVHLQSTLRSVCAYLSQIAHRALTKRLQSFQSSFSVHLSFSSFSFGTPKWKIRSLRVTTKWGKKLCVKVAGILIHYTSKTSF